MTDLHQSKPNPTRITKSDDIENLWLDELLVSICDGKDRLERLELAKIARDKILEANTSALEDAMIKYQAELLADYEQEISHEGKGSNDD